MKKLSFVSLVALLLSVPSFASAQPACTPTGFFRDGINLTAALINPGHFQGTVNATGCHVAVYFSPGAEGSVKFSDISNSTYFGVLVDGSAGVTLVDVEDNSIHNIGEVPFNGAQHGVGVYYVALSPNGSASGSVARNRVYLYQKGGIVANGEGVSAMISDNEVFGLGPVGFIAQNGIQVGYGAMASVTGNKVLDNVYTGTSTVSGGIIVVGGPFYGLPYTVKTKIMKNDLGQNDVGVYLSNLAANGNAPTTATNIHVVNNTIGNSYLRNGIPYQAGVADIGNNDKIINNTILGAGYDPNTLPGSTYAVDADKSFTNKPKVHAIK